MTDTPEKPDLPEIPEAVSEPRRRFSIQLVWIIPLLAALIGLSLGIKAFLQRGHTITITFKTGEGMEAGKTKIKYKDVQIGEVKAIAISSDRSHVIVTADISNDAKGLLVKDTRFYVVRARISGGNVTGLGTLLGGSYIGLDVGKSKDRQDEFVGLETPPAVSMDVPGRQFVLHAADVGSLETGSPILYRRMQVGQVTSTELDRDGRGVTLKIFVRAPFDQYVRSGTVFWQASGIDMSVSASGVKVNTESMVSILLGGISFLTPDNKVDAPRAESGSVFALYPSRDEAQRHSEVAQPFLLVFGESVRGLAVGAPVDLHGVTVGEVAKIDLALDSKRKHIYIPVLIQLYPDRLRVMNGDHTLGAAPGDHRQLLDRLVAHGLRAELKTGSLLTGQLYIALNFSGKGRPGRIDWNNDPPLFPTVPGSMEELQKNLMQIVRKIEKLPLQEMAGDARKTLKSLDDTLKSADLLLKNVDNSVLPQARSAITDARESLDELKKTLGEARKTLGGANQVLTPDAPIQVDLRDTLREVSRAAQSLRVLGDYLEQHPESLIRGKKEEKQ